MLEKKLDNSSYLHLIAICNTLIINVFTPTYIKFQHFSSSVF